VGLEASPGTVRITNRYAFSDLSHLRAEVSLDSQASWQELELPAIAPGGSAEVALPVHEGAATTVRLTTREAQGPVPAGHLIVSADQGDPDRLRSARPPSAAWWAWARWRSSTRVWTCTARRWTTSAPAPAPRWRRAGSGSGWTTPGAAWSRSAPTGTTWSCAAGSAWTAPRSAPTSSSAGAATTGASTSR